MNDFAHLRRSPTNQGDVQGLRSRLIEEVSTILEFFVCGLEEDLANTQGEQQNNEGREADDENTYKCSETCKEKSIKRMLHKSAFNT